jgi:hypothetical protein
MSKVKRVQTSPRKVTLEADESGETFVRVRPATLADEGKRYDMLFSGRETAYITDIAMVETWLTLVECNIVDEDDMPVLAEGMPYEEFSAGLTAIWNADPDVFWEIHEAVRGVNTHWQPEDEEGEAEGND